MCLVSMSEADEQVRIRERDRGAHVKTMMANALWDEVWDGYKAVLMDRWAASPIADTEGRETLHLMVRLLDTLRGEFEEIRETGMFAERQLEELKDERTRRERSATDDRTAHPGPHGPSRQWPTGRTDTG